MGVMVTPLTLLLLRRRGRLLGGLGHVDLALDPALELGLALPALHLRRTSIVSASHRSPLAGSYSTSPDSDEDVERQERRDHDVGYVDDFADRQVDRDAADRVCLLAGEAAIVDQMVDHREEGIARQTGRASCRET